MISYKKKRKRYRANRSSFHSYSTYGKRNNYHQKKQEKSEVLLYVNRLITQTLICLCVFIGVLVMQRIPNSPTYLGIRNVILNEIPFSRYSDMYESFLINLFPLSHRVPAKQPELTTTVSGLVGEEGSYQEEAIPIAMQLAQNVSRNIVANPHGKGVLVGILEGEEISSFVSGIVIDKGINANEEIGSFITIQRPDDWLVTIGLLEDVMVSRLEHISIGDVLGTGSVYQGIEDKRVYYVAIQDGEGEYIDINNYFHQLINEAGE